MCAKEAEAFFEGISALFDNKRASRRCSLPERQYAALQNFARI